MCSITRTRTRIFISMRTRIHTCSRTCIRAHKRTQIDFLAASPGFVGTAYPSTFPQKVFSKSDHRPVVARLEMCQMLGEPEKRSHTLQGWRPDGEGSAAEFKMRCAQLGGSCLVGLAAVLPTLAREVRHTTHGRRQFGERQSINRPVRQARLKAACGSGEERVQAVAALRQACRQRNERKLSNMQRSRRNTVSL